MCSYQPQEAHVPASPAVMDVGSRHPGPQQPLTLKTHSILLDSTLILWVGFMENNVATGWLQGRASGL